MAGTERGEMDQPVRLRLWPGVAALTLQWLIIRGLPLFMPGNEGKIFGMMAGLIGGVVIFLWWVFLSRAPRAERWGGLFLMVASLGALSQLIHESLGPHWFVFYPVPVLCLAFVGWAVASRSLVGRSRWTTMITTVLLVCGMWTLVRSDGITGNHTDIFAWRWAKTPEERLLAQASEVPSALSATPPATEGEAFWPGFRGPARDAVIADVRIDTDWASEPPLELWRGPIGPGWSSFAVRGDLFYTQEQRGDDEVVACYRVSSGESVWRHHDEARFWEPHAGAGPRGTPALGDGRVFSFGATGILNALNAADGAVLWSRNAVTDNQAKIPDWGFSNSPLLLNGLVIVHAGALLAYDQVTGEQRWSSPVAGAGYSSAHLLTLEGVPQILLPNGSGLTSVAAADGNKLWQHAWPGDSRIVQPALTADGDILIGSGFMSGTGTRSISVALGTDGWTTQERWTSTRLKPYFNDLVTHEGYAFGFDGRILACIDLENGERQWKGGRYGHGQILLLTAQSLLIVLSEKGELALVQATPDRFTELARFPAVEGKTWNHPVLVGDVLLVRNSQEMAAFRLSPARD